MWSRCCTDARDSAVGSCEVMGGYADDIREGLDSASMSRSIEHINNQRGGSRGEHP